MSARRYKYHAALSFAGEDRRLAAKLFRTWTRRGLSIFYDANREAHLWGKTSAEFDHIYGAQSQYVIPIISKHYVNKDWTRYEFEAALREQKKRRDEFILPIRLDDSPLLGLRNDVIRPDARQKRPDEIAALLLAKLSSEQREKRNNKRPTRSQSLSWLKNDVRRALELIGYAAVPLPLPYFEKLFPRYNWKQLVRKFGKAGFLTTDPMGLRLRKPIARALRNDREQRTVVNDKWITRLFPLAGHIDLAAFLSVHLIIAKRYEEAACFASSMAQQTNLGPWNQVYVTILSALARKLPFSKLSQHTQIGILNSLGICLTNAGRQRDAMKRFAELRSLSRKYRNGWGFRQSLLNAGVAADRDGDTATAEELFWAAAKEGTKSRDHGVRGRALNNLAQIYISVDVERAELLLAKSLAAKAAAQDLSGLIAGLIVSGNLAAARERFSEAIERYKQAAQTASSLGLRYEQALSTYNLGRALQDVGQRRRAEYFYARAQRLATADDYADVLLLSLNALAASAFAECRYREAHEFARHLLRVSQRANNEEFRLGALHLLAVSSLARGRNSQSKKKFAAALHAARKADSFDWSVRCLTDSTRSRQNNLLTQPNIDRLRRTAITEASRARYRVAAELWKIIARTSVSVKDEQFTSDAFASANNCLRQTRNAIPEMLNLYRSWFTWAWETRRYDEALDILRKLETAAERGEFSADAIAAMDQRGVCLQELGHFAKAEALHRAAATAARGIKNYEQEERSLNNLGEALRRLTRYNDAVRTLYTAEKIARKANRRESAISTAHNRALALEQLGKPKDALYLLRRCRDDARNHRLWPEYIRAWEALANLACLQGKSTEASQLYRRALSECRKRQALEFAPEIATNYARLLGSNHKPRAAVRVMAPFRAEFEKFVDAHEYLATLAKLYEEIGDLRSAAETWKSGADHATRIKNLDFASHCAEREATMRAKFGDRRRLRALLAALRTEEDPARRVSLLIERFRFITASKSEKHAQETLDEILRLCADNQLYQQQTETYLIVGDETIFSRTYDQKLTALKAYTMAILSAFNQLGDFGRVASRIVTKITAVDSPINQEELTQLLQDFEKQISTDLPRGSQSLRLAMWPFQLASELFPLRAQPKRFLEKLETLTSRVSIAKYLAS